MRRAQVEQASQVPRSVGLRNIGCRTNHDWDQKLDNMLVSGAGFGLAAFRPRRRLIPVPSGAGRIFVVTEASDGDDGLLSGRRSRLRFEGGSVAYEAPRLLVGNGLVSPALHLCIDQGSKGLPRALWLLVSQRLRMSSCFDVFHRLHNDMLGGLATVGLAVWRLEFTAMKQMRRGPLGGQGSCSILWGIGTELRNFHSSSFLVF